VTEQVLNHVSGSRAGIVGVYQRHDFASEKRAALEAWGEHALAIINGLRGHGQRNHTDKTGLKIFAPAGAKRTSRIGWPDKSGAPLPALGVVDNTNVARLKALP